MQKVKPGQMCSDFFKCQMYPKGVPNLPLESYVAMTCSILAEPKAKTMVHRTGSFRTLASQWETKIGFWETLENV